MTYELVLEAEGAVLDGTAATGGAAGEDDGGGVGDAADEAHVAQHGFVLAEAEGASGRDEVGVGTGFEIAGEGFVADGLGKVDGVVDAVALAGIDADELFGGAGAFADFDGLEDAEVFALAALAAQAGGQHGGDVGLRGAIENGNFEIVDFDDDVVDAEADEGGQQMLGGGDQHALAHEAGGVGNARDVATDGGDFEVVEIGATEDNAGAGRGRDQAQFHGCSGVEADAFKVEGIGNGLLELCVLTQCWAPCVPRRRQTIPSFVGQSVSFAPQVRGLMPPCGFAEARSPGERMRM